MKTACLSGRGGGAVDIFNGAGRRGGLGAQGGAKAAAEACLRGELESTGSVCREHGYAVGHK